MGTGIPKKKMNTLILLSSPTYSTTDYLYTNLPVVVIFNKMSYFHTRLRGVTWHLYTSTCTNHCLFINLLTLFQLAN
jgi:hypothetical protein